jgi:hypothetical protein
MATITITVQSLLNAATFDSYTIADTSTVSTLKTTIESATSVDADWFDLFLNDEFLATGNTLASYGVVDGTVLRSGNKIANLTTREDRQVAKLALAELRRKAGGNVSAAYYRPLNTANVDLLPTKWSGNTLVDNPNPSGAIPGRPWE